MIYIFLSAIVQFACSFQSSLTYEDQILILLNKHDTVETTVSSFINARDYLWTDSINSSRIYIELIEIQSEIVKLDPMVKYEAERVDINSDEDLFYSSPGDKIVFKAANTIILEHLRKRWVSEEALLQAWEATKMESSGLHILYRISYSEKNVDFIDKQILQNEAATWNLKYTAAKRILRYQDEIDYKEYASIIYKITNYILVDFILLFDHDQNMKKLQNALELNQINDIIKRLENFKNSRGYQNKLDEIEKAMNIIQGE